MIIDHTNRESVHRAINHVAYYLQRLRAVLLRRQSACLGVSNPSMNVRLVCGGFSQLRIDHDYAALPDTTEEVHSGWSGGSVQCEFRLYALDQEPRLLDLAVQAVESVARQTAAEDARLSGIINAYVKAEA